MQRSKKPRITCECIGIQVYSNSSNSKYFHDQIKDVVGRKLSPKSGCIKSQSGQILMDIADILKRWSQYVEELFDDVRGPRPPIRNNEGPPIMEEVRNAIRKTNHNKANGPDEILVELFDALYETCLVHFTELQKHYLRDIYERAPLRVGRPKAQSEASPLHPVSQQITWIVPPDPEPRHRLATGEHDSRLAGPVDTPIQSRMQEMALTVTVDDQVSAHKGQDKTPSAVKRPLDRWINPKV
ncbi:hypothetical protein ElyMa_002577200 [Elysia marginata]|uniref:VHS domain-containing protein n=1 Tax=Elysia marginata TaxID=1093978 RepID=A0AAV4GZC3_9GAST|nr:hypothetical protein ElyMa_002577200 [Elysia marginata]